MQGKFHGNGLHRKMNRTEKQRLDRLIAAAGLGSRRDARRWIQEGRVTVDGVTVRDPGCLVSPEQQVALNGEPVAAGPGTVMLNKPAGVITAMGGGPGPTVADLFPPALARRLFPAGRLDKDTEGLLILTDDGELCHRIISPRHGVEKEYVAKVDGAVPPDLPAAFAQGIRLADGYVTLPARLDIVEPGPPGVVRVTVTEGKYHQIKRMLAACGLRVIHLQRVRIGSVHLDPALRPGEYRPMSPEEVALLLVNPQPGS